MAKRLTQKKVQSLLEQLASRRGYHVSARKKLTGVVKDFRPDIVAKPPTGKADRIFEIEKNVSNNTIFKSIMSILYGISSAAAEGYLVVPGNRVRFAKSCIDATRLVIQRFSKKVRGAHPKVRLSVVSFENVRSHLKDVEKWDSNGRPRGVPRVPYLPTP
jgi:hypothetical protein